MAGPLLHICNDPPRVGLVPAPVKLLGSEAELDDEVAGQVLRLNLAALFSPQPQQGGLVIAHDDPGVRTTYKRPPLGQFSFSRGISAHMLLALLE
jgi:hypothetical protein